MIRLLQDYMDLILILLNRQNVLQMKWINCWLRVGLDTDVVNIGQLMPDTEKHGDKL